MNSTTTTTITTSSADTNRNSLSNPNASRNQFVERSSTNKLNHYYHSHNGADASPGSLRGQPPSVCDPCRHLDNSSNKKRVLCNGQRPSCDHCLATSQPCTYNNFEQQQQHQPYSMQPHHHARGVFSTNMARRLSSGSACETCRRRKTKCDGLSPCSYCANNNIECINNSERRKRATTAISSSLLAPRSSKSSSTNTTTAAAAATAAGGVGKNHQHRMATSSSSVTSRSISHKATVHASTGVMNRSMTAAATTATLSSTGSGLAAQHIVEDVEAIDRIEDRLRRIERLMTAFTPSTQQPAAGSADVVEATPTARIRKMSSPVHHQHPLHRQQQQYRDVSTLQRHSIHSLAAESRLNWQEQQQHISSPCRQNTAPYASPPNSNGSQSYIYSTALSNSTSPPSSPQLAVKNSNNKSSASVNMTQSMLNLSLSPSSSSTSSTLAMQQLNTATGFPASEWRKSPPIPSLMDQLSKCTFVATASNYSTVQYPIYPIYSTTNSSPAVAGDTGAAANTSGATAQSPMPSNATVP